MTAPLQVEPRHVCIVLLSGIGDVVHGLPVANALRDRYPAMRVTWVAEPAPAEILRFHRSIDNIVVYRREDGLAGILRLREQLRSLGPFDLTLNFNIYLKSIWPTLLSRAPRRIGFDRGRSNEGVWLVSNERLPPRRRAHTADMFLEFAEHLGLAIQSAEWRIEFTGEERTSQRDFIERSGGKPIATVIPASATHKKDWIPARWAEVVDVLSNRYGFHVVLAGGPGEREGRIAREIADTAKAPVEWAMQDSVRRLMWIIDASRIVVAPDTGPVHIARSLNVPVIGIYGHTNPWRVGPWRAFDDLWVDHYTDPVTGPDPSNRKPKWNVMDTIEAGEVIEKIQLAMDRYDLLSPRRLDSTV
jgi:heptosyltransferase I